MRHRGLVALFLGLAVAVQAGSARADRDDRWRKGRHGWIEVYDYQPKSGPPGTLVTITGRGFRPNMKIWFGGRKVIEESWDWATLRFYVPEAVGDGDITLRQPPGDEMVIGPFNVIEAMGAISGFAPREGPPGTRVELWGRFLPVDQVQMNGAALRVLDRGPSRMVVEIPYGARDDNFSLIRPGGGRSDSRDRFHVTLAAPFLTGMNPPSGRPGSTVALLGGGFAPDDHVFYGDREAQIARVYADRVEVIVPPEARMSRRFFVRGPRGEAGTPERFNLILDAAIRDFRPESGPPGTRVIIRGSGFLNGDAIFLGGRQLPLESGDPGALRVVIPDGANSDFFVLVRGGRTVAASGRPFVVEAPTVPPIVGSFTPRSGPPGTRVTLAGAGFTPDVRVSYGNQALPIIAHQGEHVLTVEVPRGAVASAPFIVANSRGETRSGAWFELEVAAIVDSVTPTSGPPLTVFQVRGQGFRGDETFFIGNTRLRTVERRPDGYMVQVPAGIGGGPISFETWGQRVRTPFRFDVLANPVVRWFGPTSGPPGTHVTLRGENLAGTTHVYYGGISCNLLRVQPDEVIAEVPLAAQGGDFLWLEVGGQRARTAMPFRVSVPQPAIVSFAPDAGPIGTQVVLQGGPFSPGAQVWFGNVQCPVASRSPNQIAFTIPPGIVGRAPFTVTDESGARAVSSDTFVVMLPPGPGPGPDVPHHEHAHEHPHGDGGHHHHPHVHPHRPGVNHHHPY